MRLIIYLSILLVTTLLLSSCIKLADHSIRVRNLYDVAIDNLKVGEEPYGSVEYGITSSYHSIPEGTHHLSGTTSKNQILSGSVIIQGNGKYRWTLTILSSGSLALEED